jgi:hypothetical protein
LDASRPAPALGAAHTVYNEVWSSTISLSEPPLTETQTRR